MNTPFPKEAFAEAVQACANPALPGVLTADEVASIKKWLKEFVTLEAGAPAPARKVESAVTIKLEVDAPELKELMARMDLIAQQLAVMEKLQRRFVAMQVAEGEPINPRS